MLPFPHLGASACILGASLSKLLVSVSLAALNSDIYSEFRLTSTVLSSLLPFVFVLKKGFQEGVEVHAYN